jgi:hypothetical protein
MLSYYRWIVLDCVTSKNGMYNATMFKRRHQ